MLSKVRSTPGSTETCIEWLQVTWPRSPLARESPIVLLTTPIARRCFWSEETRRLLAVASSIRSIRRDVPTWRRANGGTMRHRDHLDRMMACRTRSVVRVKITDGLNLPRPDPSDRVQSFAETDVYFVAVANRLSATGRRFASASSRSGRLRSSRSRTAALSRIDSETCSAGDIAFSPSRRR